MKLQISLIPGFYKIEPMNKLSAIPKKLYYFFLLLILFIAIVALILSVVHWRTKIAFSAEQQLCTIKERIETLNALHQKLMALVLSGTNVGQEAFKKLKKETP